MANNPKKYAGESTLSALVTKIKELFVKKTDFDAALSGKANSSHTHSISDTTNLQSTLDGKVPTSRTINNKSLTANVTLSASDVGAASSTHSHDDRYYTETEIDQKLADKSGKTHNHDTVYAAKDHSHDEYALSEALDNHTTNSDIHFTAAERTKLSGIAAGAQVNTITGVKGNSESSYRTGNVNITKANIGLGNVDNTSDANKPISTAQQLAFDQVNGAIETHTENDDIHVTTTDKTNWNAAHTHSTSAHARTDATKVEDSSTNGNIKINGTETNVYSHPTSGVAAGTYKSVSVDAQGHVVGGSNPTTLAGYGITDAEPKNAVSTHNTSTSAHDDIRLLITNLTNKLNAVANSTDTDLDTLAEIVAYIKANKSLIDSVTTNKVNVSDIINNLTTNVTNKPLSAAQGVAIKTLIDALDSALDTHNADTTKHITSTERTNWNAAKTHADSAHAPSNAEKNQNAFSNVKVGSTTIAADTTTDTLELVGSNVTITPDATNDKVTIAVADATTSAKGVVQLSDSVTSDSSTTAATSYSVRAAHKLAGQAYDLANSKADHTHNHTVSQIGDLTVSASELNYMDGVTSNVQAQLDSKASSGHNHSGSDITSGTVSASRLPVASNSASGIINTSTQTIAGQKTFASQIIAKDGILTNKNIVPDTASTRDIGTSMLPFKGVYAKDLYVKPQVIGGSISYCGRFIAEQAGTTTTRGVTTLEVGNFIEEGRDGNAQGYIEIFNNNTGSVILSTSHDDDRDLHVYLPENGGTLVTNNNVYTKDEVYSKADQKWNLLYDSGEISAIANSISNIDVSGYTNIQVLVRIYNDGDSVGSRNGSAIFKCANGKNYQFPVWANMFSKSINTVYVMATFNLVDGWLICPCASRLIGDATTFEDTEGGTAGSLAPTGSGMMKCTSPLSTLTISSLDQNSNYYFGMGSRVIVWGWNA